MRTIYGDKEILLVEDEVVVQHLIVDALEEAGFRVNVTDAGVEAMRMAEVRRPSLILLDILLPGMGGIEFLKRLKQTPWGRNIPVIMLTNLRDMEKIHEALENGAADYLVKADLKLADLAEKVKAYMKIT